MKKNCAKLKGMGLIIVFAIAMMLGYVTTMNAEVDNEGWEYVGIITGNSEARKYSSSKKLDARLYVKVIAGRYFYKLDNKTVSIGNYRIIVEVSYDCSSTPNKYETFNARVMYDGTFYYFNI